MVISNVVEIVGGVALLLGSIWVAAIRFAARQRRLGRWDERGPLHPSDPPPHR